MPAFEEDGPFAPTRKSPLVHEIGQPIDVLSVDELADRIETLRAEIARLEAAIAARRATKEAASAFFKR
jgi:uncharacterized small protein (DUF1192 family)